MNQFSKQNIRKLQAQCDAFNFICNVGDAVDVKLDGVDEPFRTVTTSKAQLLSCHTPVVWMDKVSGCYLLSRVTPVRKRDISGEFVEEEVVG